MAAWIRIRIPIADPHTGSLIRAKKEGNTASKRQKIRHFKDKKHAIKKLDPDPHHVNTDPKHWLVDVANTNSYR
jgi:hypothetical protein